MHRIDGAGHINHRFVSENPAINRPPTEITPEILNALQEELATFIEWAGVVLDKGDNTQLRQALIAKFGGLDPLALDQAGAVAFFAMSTAPAGYLKANGAAVSRTAYATLFAKIGTTFGVGDGITTFTLPDFRGEFLRGYDDGRGVDSGRGIGTSQISTQILVDNDQLNVLGSLDLASNNLPALGYEAGIPFSLSLHYTNSSTVSYLVPVNSPESFNRSIRPRNIALLACIKY